MTTKEAIQAMLDGKKVRATNWEEGYYIQFSENDGFIDKSLAMIDVIPEDNWEIYEEQKPVQTVTIEKWLYKYEKTKFIVEIVNIDEYIKEFGGEQIKLLETYEVTL